MLGGMSICAVGMSIAVVSSQSMTTVPGSNLICLNCEAFRVVSCSFRFDANIVGLPFVRVAVYWR